MIERVVENTTKLRNRIKGKVFRSLLPQDGRKLKQIIVKQSSLAVARIFEKAGIDGIKMDKRC